MSVFFRNFFSSIEQYSARLKNAFDEGPVVISRATGVNSSSINTAEIDQFRQGVEITQNKHTVGLVKIYAGTPGHIVRPIGYGISDYDIVTTGSFHEVDNFDPTAYLRAQQNNFSASLTFPIIAGDNNSSTNYDLNGIIEPLSIRPVASFFSIEFPFESHAVRGAVMAGNTEYRKFASDRVLTVDSVPTKLSSEKIVGSGSFTTTRPAGRAYENKAWFLDASEALLSSSHISTTTDIPQLGAGYTNPDLNNIDPFSESKDYLESLGITIETHGIDMASVFNTMTGSSDNYVPPGKRSATAGFVYDNAYPGTDSIAFGGMTY